MAIDVATLERRAAEAQRLADEAKLAEVCRLVGIGVRAAQGEGRDAETVRRREMVAWILAARLKWTRPKVAGALHRTERQVRRMLKKAS